ncbi:hypothetical protein I549_2174 [Mycobacterium avium subsp. avium 2285 (R)]|nr:hypothetical protein L837_1137 [Mycobacterium avium MAV_061107_1842]EUA35884.1 hypothetical protein I549_2174 [Mycobacterium avium subsp. avium 2285 (R)]
MPPERKDVKMNSTGTKKVLKGAAAAAGFVLVLFARPDAW